MKKYVIASSLIICIIAATFAYKTQISNERNITSPDYWRPVQNVFGFTGSTQDGVLKFTFPRSDLNVKVSGIPVEPGLALTSWMAFKKTNDQSMVMGDLVLLQSETDAVMSNLNKNGIDITALHNHLLREIPRIMYMHFEGHGNPVKLARIMKSTLSLTGTPLNPQPPKPPIYSANWTKIESIIGKTGNKTGDLLQFSFPRADEITEDDVVIPPPMGVATGIGFQAIGNEVAATGDFALVASEVNPVIRALIANGIRVTAVHNHMLVDEPRLFFLHFWAFGNPEKITYGLKTALDQTNSLKQK